MILVRSFLIVAALFVSNVSFANDTAGNVEPTYDRYWQCQAHSVYGDWNVYTGQVHSNKYEAQRSAIYACETREDRCKPHRCRRVSSYDNRNHY